MSREKPLLTELAVKGKPLAEVRVQPFEQELMIIATTGSEISEFS